MSNALNRNVQILEYPSDIELRGHITTFSQCLNVQNIILLGDPGLGKTFTFQAASKKEKAKFLSAREFLVLGNTTSDTIYIDGIDEYRSRVDDNNLILELIRRLSNIGCPRMRISCRVADWLGETDLTAFRAFFRDSSYIVLKLETLRDEEIESILQKCGLSDPAEFIVNAKDRGIDGLLRNPQTLIMLAHVVQKDAWPSTKRELYDHSLEKLLSEHNKGRRRKGLDEYDAFELINPAGAACASLLISGVPGICLDKRNNGYPSYRTIPLEDRSKVHAALMRRAFSLINTDTEAVSYIHRTIAEYAAAKWLVLRVRDGLPIRRIQSLICNENVPAPDLRGLHAWIATLLSENANYLINADPYGILLYGDPASLSPSDRKTLLSALDSLSRSDPWFFTWDISNHSLGALSGTDMVDSFRRLLTEPSTTPQLRNLILDVIRNGPTLQELRNDLIRIVSDKQANYRDRRYAIDALHRVVPNGPLYLKHIYKNTLSKDPTSARLRAYILSKSYSGYFNALDVYGIFQDYINNTQDHAIGDLWILSESLPLVELPDILNVLTQIKINNSCQRVSKHEIELAFSKMLERALTGIQSFTAKQIWKWLIFLYSLHHPYGYSSHDHVAIRTWLSANSNIALDMFEISFNELIIAKHKWDFIRTFRFATMNSLSDEDIATRAFAILQSKRTLNDKTIFLYETCLGLVIYTQSSFNRVLFDNIYNFAQGKEKLIKARDELCSSIIQEWRWEDSARILKDKEEQERRRAQDRNNLRNTATAVRAGSHLRNLEYLAQLYFGQFYDVDRKLSPIERLKVEIGEELTNDALLGFTSILNRTDLPTPTEIAETWAEDKIRRWWYCILAGVDETWIRTKDLINISDAAIKAALTIDIVYSAFTSGDNDEYRNARDWKKALSIQRPDLFRAVYRDIALIEVSSQKEHRPVLYEISHSNESNAWMSSLAMNLLDNSNDINPEITQDLVLAAVHDYTRNESLLRMVKAKIADRTVKGRNRTIWLSIGFLLGDTELQNKMLKHTQLNVSAIWTLKHMIDSTRYRELAKSLSMAQLEKLIIMVGKMYKNTGYPTGGFTGNTNPWDAAEFVRNCINALSASSSIEASKSFSRLLNRQTLKSYSNNLRHALASQAVIRRAAEYKQPSWDQVIMTLSGGKPANISDLHALTCDHLHSLKTAIRHSNTDIYKAFWRYNSYGSIKSPAPEEYCRDRLVDILKPQLFSLEIRVEPEGHMAADKRADIVLLPHPGMKLPLELKRDTHKDLWKACVTQLDRLYTRDPESLGYGIYGVFWFGKSSGRNLPKPPSGIPQPKTAAELENALKSLIPTDKRHCLDAVVFDLTPPAKSKRYM